MRVRILTLCENTVRRPGLIAEHGLSFLIENEKGTVLFDTGQGMALVPNAKALDVDLRTVGCVVLSHGHFDHTGGLRRVLEEVGPRQVFAHPDALMPKYAVRDGKAREIGMPEGIGTIEQAGGRFCLHEGAVEILPGITATGYVPRVTGFETVHARFQTGVVEDLRQDLIRDDQALIVETGEGPVVVLGCAHAGLINTLLYAAKLTGSRRFAGVLGGTHLVDADERCLAETIDALRQFEIGRFAPCHCTGFVGQARLWQALGEGFVLNMAGDALGFGSCPGRKVDGKWL